MKQHLFFLTFLSIILLIISICICVSAQDGRGGGGLGGGKGDGNYNQNSSILSDLLSTKYILGGFVALLGLILLKTIKINQQKRALLMCAVFVLFGVLVIMHQPNPLSSVTDAITSLLTGTMITVKKLIMLLFMGVLSIIGSKLFCGWVCPIGAIQEIVNNIPVPYKIGLSFKLSNSIRVSLFIISLIMVLTVGYDLYRNQNILNPFELFEWGDFGLALIVLTGVILIASVFTYRPFCYLVCPVGLLSWLLEHISIFRVRIDRNKCIDCNICISKSPCTAVKSILDCDIIRPDCFACGICIEACLNDALEFRFIKKKGPIGVNNEAHK